MIYVYDAKLEVNGISANKCISHSDDFLLSHLVSRGDNTKLWFFYKFYNKILYPITLNIDIKNKMYLLHPGINRYLGMLMAGQTHVNVRLFSTSEYKDIEQDFPLQDICDAESYQPVILCKLSHLPFHIVEVKNDKTKKKSLMIFHGYNY